MDGTLLDSMGMWRNLQGNVLKSLGITLSQEDCERLDRLNMAQATQYVSEKFNKDLSAEQIGNLWIEIARKEYMNDIQPKPGVKRYLELLYERGVKMAVATMTRHILADDALARHGLDKYFSHILTVEDVGGVPKTDPKLFLLAADKLGSPVSECIVFEDSPFAAQCAKTAGFELYCVADRYSADYADMMKSICDRYVTDFNALCDELVEGVPL